jgi:diguanylate cyclase (GGDEF)-like protein
VQANFGRAGARDRGAFVVTLTEINAQKVNEANLLHRALHDALTGLLNQSAFLTRVADAVATAATDDGMCSVLYLDLDHFKEINDALGHTCGDHLLTAVSRRLGASLRPSDTLARLGGDEIGILCPTLESEDEAFRLAERIVTTIGQPFTIDERVVRTSVSVGLAFSNESTSTAAALVEQADHAMYRAKSAGRAQWATFTDARTAAPIGPADVRGVLVRVVEARGRLHDLLDQLDLTDDAWERLALASRALTSASQLLEGQYRIG